MTIIEALTTGAIKLETVRIIYMKKGGVTKAYTIEPYAFKTNRQGRPYCYAWSVEGNHYGTFYMAKIFDAEVTGIPFAPRRNVQIA